MLNLALVFERFGHTEAFVAQPLFRCQRLNRALILKHALREHERALFDRPEPHTTKIVFPYSPLELGLGGTSVMIGEKRFDQLFRNAIGGGVSEADYDADFELLSLLHDLPAFDPFLLREQLKRVGREPAKCFFEISEADVADMLEFVRREIEPLTSLAFGAAGRSAEKLSMRFSEKLMTDENAPLLTPLREMLRLSQGEYVEGVFAWKGFLYYQWLLRGFAERHKSFAPTFAGCKIIGDNRSTRMAIEQLKQEILARIKSVVQHAGALMLDYKRGFAALTRGDAAPFRGFVLDAPAKFQPLGEATGAIKHIHSFWGFRFPGAAAPSLEAEEAQDILQEFERMLSGVGLSAQSEDLLLC